MTSSDREILISINGRLERIELRLDNLEARVAVLETKIDVVQTSVYWGFAVMGLIFAFVSIFAPAITAMFTKIAEFKYDSYHQKENIREIIREEISQTLKHNNS